MSSAISQAHMSAMGEQEVAQVARLGQWLESAVAEVVRGKPNVIRLAVIALLAEGHVLVDDAPGLGKTSLARALATAMGGKSGRIQFTPDLLPSDVTGGLVYDQRQGTFEFRPGPVFAHVVVADEINRASPKTQSALLEVMAERQVTVDGTTHPTPRPFAVLATQNPIETDGTYRLPEAQLDRFMVRLSMGYPSRSDEVDILRGSTTRSVDRVAAVAEPAHVVHAISVVKRVAVHDALYDYIADLCASTRQVRDLRLGVSPRGGIALLAAARASAALNGRSYVIPEDVRSLAEPVLAHRLIVGSEALRRGRSATDVLGELLHHVPVPGPGSVTPTYA
jgi:MoxR-like ATPase